MTELWKIPIGDVHPNPDQPRVEFDEIEINSLAESIQEQGLIQPIVVEQRDGHYVLIDGERRLRAVKSLGWGSITAVVHTYDEKPVDKLVQAVTANLQRADLNPIEEGQAFKRLHASGMTISKIARLVGKSTTHVSFRIKLLEFEPEIRELFAARRLPIDPSTIYDILDLPSDVRVRMMRNFAANGTSCTVIKRTVRKYLERAEKPDVPLSGRKRAPAAIMSDMQAENWMMTLAGGENGFPGWELIEKAARETCDNCELSDMASAQMCRDCPAVELLKRLKRLASDGSSTAVQ